MPAKGIFPQNKTINSQSAGLPLILCPFVASNSLAHNIAKHIIMLNEPISFPFLGLESLKNNPDQAL